MNRSFPVLLLTFLCFNFKAFSQLSDIKNDIEVSGDFQTDFQYYQPDSLIGAATVPEKIGSNSYLNLLIRKGNNLTAGARFEMYQPALQGFDPRYKGMGIPYAFIQWNNKSFDITVGNFYEQFGNSLVLRSYWDWGLGYDNSLKGVRLKYAPLKGINIKALIGKQRYYWSLSDGTVRGIDVDFDINEIFASLNNAAFRVLIGGNIVSKYQEANDVLLNLPENVSAPSGRIYLAYRNVSLNSEYALKINDPSASNNSIYKEGNALLVNLNYSVKSFGISITAKRIDNMDFRSDRLAIGNDLLINYIPPSTIQSTYSLMNVYLYPSRPLDEMSIQSSLFLTIPKGTFIGGKYGTKIVVNYAKMHTIHKEIYPSKPQSYLGYKSDFFKIGDDFLFENLNFELTKKISSRHKCIANYAYVKSNDELLQMTDYHKLITAHIFAIDYSYRFRESNTIRAELQQLSTKNDRGNWVSALAEYTTTKFFMAVSNDYNYGNSHTALRQHYVMGHLGIITNKSRLSFSYGRRKQGIICVGGVCRQMPATNGLSGTFTTSF